MNCTRSSLYEAFRPFNIPFDAKLVDVLEIGSNADPEAGVEVSVWEGDTDGNHFMCTEIKRGGGNPPPPPPPPQPLFATLETINPLHFGSDQYMIKLIHLRASLWYRLPNSPPPPPHTHTLLYTFKVHTPLQWHMFTYYSFQIHILQKVVTLLLCSQLKAACQYLMTIRGAHTTIPHTSK